MIRADDGELRALQARAYGPHADIQLDPAALCRLRELEGKTEGRVESAAAATDRGPDASAPEAPPTAPAVAPVAGSTAATASRPAWAIGVRRPSVPVVLALIVAVALVVVGLLLPRRTQSDPLDAGATQIARLPVDTGYTVPTAVGGGSFAKTGDTRGFREFHGLRAVVATGAISTGIVTGDACLSVYPAEEVTDARSTTFSGHLWSGCAAGAFPATAQFRVTSDLPADVRAGFPSGEALQFVYDSAHNDVVVYATR